MTPEILRVRAQIKSLPGGAEADPTGDPTFAKLAGIPLAASYAPPADVAAQPQADANPCLGEDVGWASGLAASFFAGPFDSSAKATFPLDFSGNATVRRRAPGLAGKSRCPDPKKTPRPPYSIASLPHAAAGCICGPSLLAAGATAQTTRR